MRKVKTTKDHSPSTLFCPPRRKKERESKKGEGAPFPVASHQDPRRSGVVHAPSFPTSPSFSSHAHSQSHERDSTAPLLPKQAVRPLLKWRPHGGRYGRQREKRESGTITLFMQI